VLVERGGQDGLVGIGHAAQLEVAEGGGGHLLELESGCGGSR
jgi:hypothetical protein